MQNPAEITNYSQQKTIEQPDNSFTRDENHVGITNYFQQKTIDQPDYSVTHDLESSGSHRLFSIENRQSINNQYGHVVHQVTVKACSLPYIYHEPPYFQAVNIIIILVNFGLLSMEKNVKKIA